MELSWAAERPLSAVGTVRGEMPTRWEVAEWVAGGNAPHRFDGPPIRQGRAPAWNPLPID